MSRANGEVIRDGITVGTFLFNGTINQVWDGKIHSPASRDAHWAEYHAWQESGASVLDSKSYTCDCRGSKQFHEDVILYSDYGGGFHWAGSVCWGCRCIVEGRSPGDDDLDITSGRHGPQRFEEEAL